MSRYSYEGSPHEATANWRVEVSQENGVEYHYIAVPVACDCGCPGCKAIKYRPHTNGMRFEGEDGHEKAMEWMESVQQALDEDYDDYYNENSHAIVQMERYEQFRNEY